MITINVFLLEWRKEKSLHGWASVGIQYIAAVLNRENHTAVAEVFEGIEIDKTGDIILSMNPDIVGITIFRENLNKMYQLVRYIKQKNPQVIVIAGGHTATLYANKILKSHLDIDIISYGEGETTFIELCRLLESGGTLDKCQGIFYRYKDHIFKNPPRKLLEDLDSLPNPDLNIVKKINYEKNPYVFTSISTSRGCLGNCGFCVEHRVSKGTSSVQWRGRTPVHVVQEIKELRQAFPSKRLIVNFVDGSIEDPDPIAKSRLNEMMDLLEHEQIPLAFSFLTRAESWSEKDVELIKKMRRLGLFCASIGLEGGTDETLKLFGKKATLEDNLRAYQIFKSYDISVNGFLILFHPYVKLHHLEKTAKFIKQCDMAFKMEAWSNAVYIYPDTRMFQKVVADGLITGTDETGFMYNYAFIDGRVEKIYQVVKSISADFSVIQLQNILDKAVRAIQLYQVWRKQYEEFVIIEELMNEFILFIEDNLDSIGNYQYDCFLEMVDNVKMIDANHKLNETAANWIEFMRDKHPIVEKYWLQVQMKLMRLGVKLV